MRPTDFATHLTAFLTGYLPAQRNVSPNTIKAYRDAFVLLLRYCRDVRRIAPERLGLELLLVGVNGAEDAGPVVIHAPVTADLISSN